MIYVNASPCIFGPKITNLLLSGNNQFSFSCGQLLAWYVSRLVFDATILRLIKLFIQC